MNRKDQYPQFSAVIFDLDGLVLDTEFTYFLAWKEAGSVMGCEFSDDFCYSLSGLQFQDIEQRLFKHGGADFDLNRFHQLSGEFWRQIVAQQGIPVKKGFFNLLEQLNRQQVPFCLATNSRQINALECLELAGLSQVFSTIISRDQVSQGKPAPDIFLATAQALLTPIAQCLVLEDSAIGIQAAVDAGAISVLVPSIQPVHAGAAYMADYIYTDLDQVAEIIKYCSPPAV